MESYYLANDCFKCLNSQYLSKLFYCSLIFEDLYNDKKINSLEFESSTSSSILGC